MLNKCCYVSYNLVYILKCEDDCWYVGISTNLNARLGQHFSEEGGCSWTRKHKALELVKVFIGCEKLENKITEILIKNYGLEKVSGGKYVKKHRYKKITICYWLKSIQI